MSGLELGPAGHRLGRGESHVGLLKAPAAAPRPRESVRCRRCFLVQFRTRSGLCRRCAVLLPASPQLDFGSAGGVLVVESKPSTAASSSRKVCVRKASCPQRGDLLRELNLGRRLRDLRKQRGLTQHVLAARAKVPRSYISRIETTRLLPGPVMVKRLADVLAVDVLVLLAGKGSGLQRRDSDEDFFWREIARYVPCLRSEDLSILIARVRRMAAANRAEKPLLSRNAFSPRRFRVAL